MKLNASPIVRRENPWMLSVLPSPCTVTARISGLSRAPWQAAHVRRLMYWRMRWRESSLSVVA